MSGEAVHFFLQLRNQIKLYHWQTKVYSRHIATDAILDKLDKSIDSYVEVYIGKYGRPRLTGKNMSFTMHNLSEAGATRLITSSLKYISGPLTKQLHTNDTDLMSIRDDIMADLNQLLYLFTLK